MQVEETTKQKEGAYDSVFLQLAKRTIEQRPFSPADRTEKTVLKGNPEIGTVTHIRQIHSMDGEVSENFEVAVGLYQLAVYKELQSQNAPVVFCERLDNDKEYTEPVLDRIRAEFDAKDFDPEHPTKKQLSALNRFGGDVVYAARNPHVELLGTQSPSLYSLGEEAEAGYKAKFLDKHYGQKEIIYFARERVCAKEVRKYLDVHPGAKVAVSFGALHNLGFDFRRDLPLSGLVFEQFGEREKNDMPVVQEVFFPKAYALTELAAHWEYAQTSKYWESLKLYLNLSRIPDENNRRKDRKRKRNLKTQRIVDEILQHVLSLDESKSRTRSKL